MRSCKSIKTMCFVLIAILSLLPLSVLADDGDINHGEGEYDVSTGDGKSDWKYWTGGRGIRISIYFVEGEEENFSKNTKQVKSEESEEIVEVPVTVYQIGKPTDFAKYNPYYTVDVYTRRSVFDYMNKSGTLYKPILTVDEPYKCIVDQSKSITKSMPDPKRARQRNGQNNVMHRDITGYGTKDYTKYVESKYVRFPFDVYIESAPDNYVYVKANT